MSAKTKVAVVDFGTSKIVTLVAENSSAERCKLIGIGVANYAGYVQEGWNDPEHLDEQIESSIRDAEKTMRGADVTELYVGVPAMFTQVYASETTITLKGADPRVTQQDVMNAVSEASAGSLTGSMALTLAGRTARAALLAFSVARFAMRSFVALFTMASTAAQTAEMSVSERMSWRIFFTF